jgi:hypothetical protein
MLPPDSFMLYMLYEALDTCRDLWPSIEKEKQIVNAQCLISVRMSCA